MKKTIVLVTLSFMMNDNLSSQTMNNVGSSYPGTPSALNGTNSQLHTAADNQLLFQGNSVFGSDASRNAIRIGIGVFDTPINGVVDRLHLHDITASKVFSRYTNLTTQQTSSDGLIVGIDSAGHAVFKQYESLPMKFYTSNTERMRIISNGAVGINSAAPNNRLEITSASGDPYFSTGSSSGLRLTNLTNSATPTASSSAVLGVDANGDVILVNSVATATASSSKNGLNSIVGSPDVELGGTLIRHTTVDMSGFNLVFNKKGRHGIGEFLTTSNLSNPISAMDTNNAKTVFDNGDYESAQASYAYAPSGFNKNYVYGSRILSRNDNASATGSGAYGSTAQVFSNGLNAGFYADVKSSSSNVSGQNVGFWAEVEQNKEAIGAFLTCNQGAAYASVTGSKCWGVRCITSNGNDNEGINTIALNGIRNYGGWFSAEQNTGNPDFINNTGVRAIAVGGPHGIGVDSYAQGGGDSYNCIGVSGYAFDAPRVIGIYGVVPANNAAGSGSITNLAGYFDGDIVVNGTASLVTYPVITSDRNMKTNIKPIENGLDIINKLRPKTYNLTNANFPQLNVAGTKTQYGLIAQEVEEVFPDIVSDVMIPGKIDKEGKEIYPNKESKGVSYVQLIAVLIKGMQEQQQQIAALTDKVQQLSGNGSAGSKTGSTSSNSQNNTIDLADANTVVLEQNVPNPFMESTVIRFTLPKPYNTAKIMFTTIDGKQLKTVDVSSLSGNFLTVYASGVSNGLYYYSLLIDEKIIDTKKMIKE